jgi:hypothetical protein
MAQRQASASPARPSRAKKVHPTPMQGRPAMGAQVFVQRPPLLLSQEEAADELGIGITLFSEERAAGNIPTVEIGRRKLVPYVALVEYVKRLCAEQGVSLDDAALAL